jgi:hypothetical protein
MPEPPCAQALVPSGASQRAYIDLRGFNGFVPEPESNVYSVTKGQAAIITLVRAMRDRTGNLPAMPGIFPDFPRADRAYRARRQWMTAPAQEALKLQRPLPDGSLKIVMTGEKEDPIA